MVMMMCSMWKRRSPQYAVGSTRRERTDWRCREGGGSVWTNHPRVFAVGEMLIATRWPGNVDIDVNNLLAISESTPNPVIESRRRAGLVDVSDSIVQAASACQSQ